jgi:hypothetical protein
MTRQSSGRISAGPAVGELTRPTTRVGADAHLAAAANLLRCRAVPAPEEAAVLPRRPAAGPPAP